MTDRLGEEALDYHRLAPAGKLAVVATKPLATQRDLSLAYSPGVAAACELIAADPLTAAEVTARGNLVAVVTNGTAVLGLGAIGALASKPVMEGKAVLFKKFAGIDSFDIEIEERDPDKLVEIVASLEPTFGAINLEDIRAPECFIVESKLRERMKIPVFHDDQHGTAIIVAAAVRNGLFLTGKPIEEARLVASGAGAASLACLNLLVEPRHEAREHPRHRHRRRGLRGPPDPDGPVEGEVRPPHRAAHAGRGDRGGRHLPGPLRRRRAQARHGRQDGAQAADPGPGQPDAGDPARARQGGPPRRDHRHRPERLPEPGQQRPVLPVHLPRCPRRRCDHDQRGDEARLRRRAGAARPRAATRDRDRRLRRRRAALRAGLSDPQAVRHAADRRAAAGRGQGRHGHRRRHATAGGSGRLSPAPVATGDPLRPDDEADLRGRWRHPAAAGLHRRRGGARPARGAGRGRGAAGQADPDRAARR